MSHFSHFNTMDSTTTEDTPQWTTDEDTQLCDAVVRSRGDYEQASKALNYERTTEECRARGVVAKRRGQWTRLEDDYLRDLVVEALAQDTGSPQWVNIALLIPGRTGKQCRERYKNHLAPGICKMAWTAEEDARLIELQKTFGNSWCKIANELPGRAENAVKNRWNGMFNKRVGQLVASLGEDAATGEQQQHRRPRSRAQRQQRPRMDDGAPSSSGAGASASASSSSGGGGGDGARRVSLGAPDDGFMRACEPLSGGRVLGSSLPGSRRGSSSSSSGGGGGGGGAESSLDMSLSFDDLSLAQELEGGCDSLQLLSLSNLSTDNLSWSADDTMAHMGGCHDGSGGHAHAATAIVHETLPMLPPMPSPAPARFGSERPEQTWEKPLDKPRTPAQVQMAMARAEAAGAAPRTPPQHTCSPSGADHHHQTHSPQHAQAAMQKLQWQQAHGSTASAADEARARLRRRITEAGGMPPSPLHMGSSSSSSSNKRKMPTYMRAMPHLPPLEQHSVGGTCSELANRQAGKGSSSSSSSSALQAAGLSMQSAIPTIHVFSPAAKRRLCPSLTPLSPMASPGAAMLNCEWW